jgi:hypothetical protein
VDYRSGAVALLVASTCAHPAATPRCPATVQMLANAPTFSTLFGATGCVTDSAKAFLVLYEARRRWQSIACGR